MPRKELQPHKTIRDYVETGADHWTHQAVARDLYRMADVFDFYFFAKQTPRQLALPRLVLAVAPDDVRVLAFYRLKQNPNGLNFEISFNARHLDRPRWSLYETLLHEKVHLFQEYLAGKQAEGKQSCTGGYHNKQFVGTCEEMGLHPLLGTGAHDRPADGQFARLMDRYAVAPPRPVAVPTETPKANWWDIGTGAKPKGSSTLVLYTAAACVKKPVCKIRSGQKELHIVCADCGGVFRPQARSAIPASTG